MTENEHVPPSSVDGSETRRLLPIARDANFVRIAADDIIVVHRGRDVQISLIAEGPEPSAQALPGGQQSGFAIQEVQVVGSFTEIARVGLPPATAFSMAMNIVETALAAGNVPIGPFRERFLAMLDEHDKVGEELRPETSSPPREQ